MLGSHCAIARDEKSTAKRAPRRSVATRLYYVLALYPHGVTCGFQTSGVSACHNPTHYVSPLGACAWFARICVHLVCTIRYFVPLSWARETCMHIQIHVGASEFMFVFLTMMSLLMPAYVLQSYWCTMNAENLKVMNGSFVVDTQTELSASSVHVRSLFSSSHVQSFVQSFSPATRTHLA